MLIFHDYGKDNSTLQKLYYYYYYYYYYHNYYYYFQFKKDPQFPGYFEFAQTFTHPFSVR